MASGCGFLRGCAERSHRKIWTPGDYEYGSRKPIYRIRLDHDADRRRRACQHGWTRALPGQHVGFACLRLIERLWRSLKYEAVYLQDIADGFAAQRVINDWMHFYNRERPHSALGEL